MGFLIFAGIVALIFGVLILFFPRAIYRVSEKVNKMTFHIDESIYAMRAGVGVSLILVAVMVMFVAYFLFRKYG
ncbi:MAG: hypothetical protein WBE75_02740 [Candidatus Omnitrophota bacterium]|jgi:uncharacterized membrane protein HdeD (DUF308 family)